MCKSEFLFERLHYLLLCLYLVLERSQRVDKIIEETTMIGPEEDIYELLFFLSEEVRS